MKLDEKERALLTILQQDARVSNAQLAEKTVMSDSSCWRKTKALEESGIIRRYSAVVDPRKMGLAFEAVVQINLDRHNRSAVDELVDVLMQCEEVIECLATTGDFDFLLRIFCPDIEAYNDFIEQHLFNHRSIRSMRTNVVLKRIKTDTPILAKF